MVDFDYGWMDRGECRLRGMAQEFFDASSPIYDEKAAKEACGACAVRSECLTLAMAIPEKTPHDLIYSGLTGEERAELTAA